jgi:hypothetical protein
MTPLHNHLRLTALLLVSLLLFCLQGPWEYMAKDPPLFKGITANVYIVNGSPIREACFERMMSLDETYTPNFAFYDSAYVTIRGDGGQGVTTVTLTPGIQTPMCFSGPDSFIGQAGKQYELKAVFFWDSSGVRVRSEINGTTSIPAQFSIADSARVNVAALLGQFDNPDSAASSGLPMLLRGLPPSISTTIITLLAPQIAPFASDSSAVLAYLIQNRERIGRTIDSVLQADLSEVYYQSGDTVTYLSNQLNLLPHTFDAAYSDDVAGILIAHRFTKDALNPQTLFDNFAAAFGDLPPSYYYFQGTKRRILFYSRIQGLQNGRPFNLFDSLTVSNAYLKGGPNTLYFYAAGQGYVDFVQTYINQHSSSKVTPLHTVTGGHGFFAGLHLDSFSMTITIPKTVTAFSTFEAHADVCSDTAWSTPDCQSFEPEYCRTVQFNEMQFAFNNPDIIALPQQHNDCLAEAVAFYLQAGKGISFFEDSVLSQKNTITWQQRSSNGTVEQLKKVFSASELKQARKDGLLRFCIRDNFGDTLCFELAQAAQRSKSYTDTLAAICTSCIQSGWQSSSCQWARPLYCRFNANAPDALCRDVK